MELHRPDATSRFARHRKRRIVAALLLACGLMALAVSGASAANGKPGRRGILVVQVQGLIDAPTVDLVRDSIKDANDRGLTMVVLQIDSRGALEDVRPLLRAIDRSRVPVVAWVGPSGAQAKGGAAVVAEGAQRTFVSQGSTIGPLVPTRLDESNGAFGYTPASPAMLRREYSASAAAKAHVVDGLRPTVGETIVQLDGKKVRGVKLSTAKVIGKGRGRRRQPNQDVVFRGLGLGAGIEHALINPSAAYFLVTAGLALIVFEFFAASVGFAAGVGALALIGGMYGFSHLPVRWWAVALLVVSAIGFAIATQADGSRFWSATAIATLIAGSVLLYGGVDLRPSWWVIAIVVIAVSSFYELALPSFVRARFSTPTIGREGMIGEMGTAEVAVDPDGVVVVRGARWRARTNRATPIHAGEPVRVVAVEGVTLEVEPETGGAKDYRERGRRRSKEAEPAPETTS